MPQDPNNNNINFSNQSDKFNVMTKETLTRLDDYYQKITSIDVALNNAKSSLQATPGVGLVVQAIDQSIQENYKRGYAYQNAVQARTKFMNTIGAALTEFEGVVNQLPEPQQATSQLKIGDSSITQSTQPTQNVQPNDNNAAPNGNFQKVK